MKNKIYSKELILDLINCDSEIIKSKKKILEYINKICCLIRMKKYGKPVIKRFGYNSQWGEGYSFFQFIEESSVNGHFLENQNLAFINIFSCKSFDNKTAKDFTKNFFKARKIKERILIR